MRSVINNHFVFRGFALSLILIASLSVIRLYAQYQDTNVVIIDRPKDAKIPDKKREPATVNTTLTPPKGSRHDAGSERTYNLSIGILVFGFLIIAMITYLMKEGKLEDAFYLKITTVVITAISSLFLVVAGYSTEQIAPAFGLLGTLVGYLLGQRNSNKPS